MKKKTQMSVKESWYVFTIVMLGIFLVACIGFFLQNPFATNLPASSGLIALGTPLNVSVEENGSNSVDLFFYGSVLPDMEIKQDVNVMLKANQGDCVVRGKVFMYDGNNKIYPLEITTANNWTKGNDEYYYCSETLTPNLSVDFLESVKTPKTDAKLNSSNIYSVIVTLEALPSDSDFQNIWKMQV